MPNLRLLLVAPACDGNDVGEPWVGYQWVRRLSERHDVTVLTYTLRGHEPLSRQLPRARVIEWADAPLVDRWERFNSLLKPGYPLFHFRCRQWIRATLKRGEHFDLGHQFIPVAMRYPCPIAGFPIPYFIGPVGGGLGDPPGFGVEDDSAPWYLSLRKLDQWRLRFDPLLARTYDNAACVLGIAPYVADSLSHRRPRRLEIMSETGIASLPDPVVRNRGDGVVRLLYVGRIVRTKGLRDAIRAVARMRSSHPTQFDVVGDGFDRAACEALTEELGLSEKVTFHGRLPRPRVDEFYRVADVFVFPSYREPGGNVMYEAMSFGLPLVVADRGGPGAAVDDASGFRVHPANPEQFADDIAAALERLVDEPELRARMGAAARARVATTALWDRKIEQLEALYDTVLGTNSVG